ncbi:MAG: hypothetical protein KIT83_12480 [Bryobacterales bacterium]|nr:hypothetical protein [Bryobacterales bacterium]
MDKQEQDLRELVFGDALSATPEAELQAISNNPARRDELSHLLRLREALLSVGEEEPPRRTVLVAPAVPASQGWWRQWFGNPGWGFAGACALAAAIVFHAAVTMNPLAQPMLVAEQAASNKQTAADTQMARIETPVSLAEAESNTGDPRGNEAPTGELDPRLRSLVDARVAEAVQAVRADLAMQHQQDTVRLVAATEERLRGQYEEEMIEVREAMYFMKKQFGRQLVANAALVSEVQ